MATFDLACEKTLRLEGGYSDHSADPGGKTRWGITEAVAREAGYAGAMIDFPIEQAKAIYRKRYWDVLGLDLCVDQAIAEEAYDAGVNCGIGRAMEWMQRAANALNGCGKRWADIPAGVGIPRIVRGLNDAAAAGPQHAARILKAIVCLRGAYYVAICEKNPALEAFCSGWISNRVHL